MKIIIIDEEIATSEVMVALISKLRKKNHVICNINNIDDAKVELEKNNYECIILDMMMHYGSDYNYESSNGGMKTGYLFLKDLRCGKIGNKNANTFVIIFSNYIDKKLKNSIECEFIKVKYIFKPRRNEVILEIEGIRNGDVN